MSVPLVPSDCEWLDLRGPTD